MRALDCSAVGLSGLCLIHCLALPVVASLSPLIATMADNDLAHALFVAAAVPVSAVALGPLLLRDGHRRWGLACAATVAIALLLAGVVGWPNGAWETPLTVAGALLLASVHLLNWQRRGRGSAL